VGGGDKLISIRELLLDLLEKKFKREDLRPEGVEGVGLCRFASSILLRESGVVDDEESELPGLLRKERREDFRPVGVEAGVLR